MRNYSWTDSLVPWAEAQDVAIDLQHDHVVRFTEPGCASRHHVEHRPDVRRGARDDLENFARRRLLSLNLGQRLRETRALDSLLLERLPQSLDLSLKVAFRAHPICYRAAPARPAMSSIASGCSVVIVSPVIPQSAQAR